MTDQTTNNTAHGTTPPSSSGPSSGSTAARRANAPKHYVVIDNDDRSTATRVAHRYRPIAIGRLKRHGFTQTEAEQWTPLDTNAFWTRNDLVDTACAFRDAGYDVVRARDWTRLDATVAEAHEYEKAGWTPHDVWNLLVTLHRVRHPQQRHCQTRSECEADEPVWIATGIPANLVPLYIRAGHTPTIASVIDASRRTGDTDIVPALHVMAALKNPVTARPPGTQGPFVPFTGAAPNEVKH